MRSHSMGSLLVVLCKNANVPTDVRYRTEYRAPYTGYPFGISAVKYRTVLFDICILILPLYILIEKFKPSNLSKYANS